jgi:hypothetical protein
LEVVEDMGVGFFLGGVVEESDAEGGGVVCFAATESADNDIADESESSQGGELLA